MIKTVLNGSSKRIPMAIAAIALSTSSFAPRTSAADPVLTLEQRQELRAKQEMETALKSKYQLPTGPNELRSLLIGGGLFSVTNITDGPNGTTIEERITPPYYWFSATVKSGKIVRVSDEATSRYHIRSTNCIFTIQGDSPSEGRLELIMPPEAIDSTNVVSSNRNISLVGSRLTLLVDQGKSRPTLPYKMVQVIDPSVMANNVAATIGEMKCVGISFIPKGFENSLEKNTESKH